MKKVETILEYLGRHNTLALSTFGGGRPHGASLFYVNIGFIIYFLSSPKSRHAGDIALNPQVAATINGDNDNWQEIKGIQLQATARLCGSLRDNVAQARAYIMKFPAVRDLLYSPWKWERRVAAKIEDTVFYEMTPDRICFIDNSISFGHREELLLKDGVPVADSGHKDNHPVI